MHVIDVGGGIRPEKKDNREIAVSDLSSLPLRALWQGLSHRNIGWHDHSHYDWQNYDTIALAGGITAKGSNSLASFCLTSSEYLNVNIRFGYHFSLIDSLCSDVAEENYILLRFAGGGETSRGKDLRLAFISRVLARLNFTVGQTGELLDARLMRYSKVDTIKRLDQLGRLLGAVRLLDMVLTDEAAIDEMVEQFFQEKYDFSHEE
jgi:pyruvate, water dikinase